MKGMDRRPHVQGDAAAIDVELTDEVLTDGAGLTVLRALWDKLEIGAYLDRELAEVGGRYRPSLHAEQWIALLAYGGGGMGHPPLLEGWGGGTVRRCMRSSGSRCWRTEAGAWTTCHCWRAGECGRCWGGSGWCTRPASGASCDGWGERVQRRATKCCGRWCRRGGRRWAACRGWCS